MFVRTKQVNGGTYAYLVVNEWTKQGSRQKTKGYLGKVIKAGPIGHSWGEGDYTDMVKGALHSCLEQLEVTFDEDFNIGADGKPAVIQLNEGYLCTHTAKAALDMSGIKADELIKILPKRLLQAGLVLDESMLLELYEKLVPN